MNKLKLNGQSVYFFCTHVLICTEIAIFTSKLLTPKRERDNKFIIYNRNTPKYRLIILSYIV